MHKFLTDCDLPAYCCKPRNVKSDIKLFQDFVRGCISIVDIRILCMDSSTTFTDRLSPDGELEWHRYSNFPLSPLAPLETNLKLT